MGISKGYTSICGWKKSTDWGTPVEVGAAYGIRFVTESIKPNAELISSEELSGSRNRLAGDKGNEFHAGDLNCEAHYEGLERIIAQAMGTAGAPAQQGGEAAYKHVFKMANELDGIHGTLVFYLQSKPCVKEYTTCKANGFSLSVSQGDPLAKINFPMIAHSLNLNEGSGTNTNTTAAAITFPSNRDFLLFSQMAIRINDASGGALANSDLIYPSEFSIQVNNNLPADDVTTAYAPYIDEPIGGGFGEVTGSIGFSKGYQDLTRLAEVLSKGQKKMDVIFTGPLATASYYFTMMLYVPDLQWNDLDFAIGGPDRIPETIGFEAHRVPTIPTGFPAGYTGALTIELINQNPADALE